MVLFPERPYVDLVAVGCLTAAAATSYIMTGSAVWGGWRGRNVTESTVRTGAAAPATDDTVMADTIMPARSALIDTVPDAAAGRAAMTREITTKGGTDARTTETFHRIPTD